MYKAIERKNDLRNASFLEVIVAIIFILVILLHSKNIDFAEEKDFLLNHINKLEIAIEELRTSLLEYKRENHELIQKNEELRRINELYLEFVDAGESVENIIQQNINLEENNFILSEQLLAAEQKLMDEGKGGVDKPFCRLPVLDETLRQKHKWLGKINWSKSGISFKIDPEIDVAKAFEIPGVQFLHESKYLSRNDFASAAKKTLEFAISQEIECRYFVIIEVDPKIDPPSSFILLIESYFYKRTRQLG